MGNPEIGLTSFSIIEASTSPVMMSCMFGSLRKCPSQIPVAIFSVARTLAFVIAEPDTGNFAAV